SFVYGGYGWRNSSEEYRDHGLTPPSQPAPVPKLEVTPPVRFSRSGGVSPEEGRVGILGSMLSKLTGGGRSKSGISQTEKSNLLENSDFHSSYESSSVSPSPSPTPTRKVLLCQCEWVDGVVAVEVEVEVVDMELELLESNEGKMSAKPGNKKWLTSSTPEGKPTNVLAKEPGQLKRLQQKQSTLTKGSFRGGVSKKGSISLEEDDEEIPSDSESDEGMGQSMEHSEAGGEKENKKRKKKKKKKTSNGGERPALTSLTGELKKMEKEFAKIRRRSMKGDVEDEEREIRQMEKKLKMDKKTRRGAVRKSLTEDGLDYLLEMCDPETVKGAADKEMKSVLTLENGDSDLEEDLAEALGKKAVEAIEPHVAAEKADSIARVKAVIDQPTQPSLLVQCDQQRPSSLELGQNFCELTSPPMMIVPCAVQLSIEVSSAVDRDHAYILTTLQRLIHLIQGVELLDILTGVFSLAKLGVDEDSKVGNPQVQCPLDLVVISEVGGTWEFSPQRTRQNSAAFGSAFNRRGTPNGGGFFDQGIPFLIVTSGSYIPPAKRAEMLATSEADDKDQEEASKVFRRIKGIMNRLSEATLPSTLSQLESLYSSHPRALVNRTLFESVTSALLRRHILTAERILLEHCLLIVALTANIGTEVGAHFLQATVQLLDQHLNGRKEIEDKMLDNIVFFLGHLHSFKVTSHHLIFDVLKKLLEDFSEKSVELLLFSRVEYMLEVLLAIRNNNKMKVPGFDPALIQHYKKLKPTLLRTGATTQELTIGYQDLLNADSTGRWWIVGSAWAGTSLDAKQKASKSTESEPTFSQDLLDLAKRMRMNTEIRRRVFCVLVSAEDFVEAFEKMLKLSLNKHQEREIIHVTMETMLQEKPYNPYYSHLVARFCQYDRRFQLTTQFTLWDKLKGISDTKNWQVSHLAKFIAHLFLEMTLPISILKVIEFSDLNRPLVRFLRQVLVTVLLTPEDKLAVTQVFLRASKSDQLRKFRESLKLFIRQFILKEVFDKEGGSRGKVGMEALDDRQRQKLRERAALAEEALSAREKKLKL
ncbi:unnamed protein product, partial [Cyprideis torosa]